MKIAIAVIIVVAIIVLGGVVWNLTTPPSVQKQTVDTVARVDNGKTEMTYTVVEVHPLVIKDGKDRELMTIERDGRIILRGKVIATDRAIADLICDGGKDMKPVPVAPTQ